MAVDQALQQNNPEAVPFWEAAEKGVFVLPTCRDCGRAHWYPRPFCPFCFSSEIEWKASEGTGEIYSYANPTPAQGTEAIVYVTLDGGPKVLSHMVESDAAKIAVGARVQVVLKTGRYGEPFPAFRLV